MKNKREVQSLEDFTMNLSELSIISQFHSTDTYSTPPPPLLHTTTTTTNAASVTGASNPQDNPMIIMTIQVLLLQQFYRTKEETLPKACSTFYW